MINSAAIDAKGRRMYIFGGYDNVIGLSNDIYYFDVNQSHWTLVKSTKAVRPPPRHSHFSCFVPGMYSKWDYYG